MRPRFGGDLVPPKMEGAGNAGCWPHPRALRAKECALCARKKPQGSRNNRHSPRNGFNGCSVLSPVYRYLMHTSLLRRFAKTDSLAAVGFMEGGLMSIEVGL